MSVVFQTQFNCMYIAFVDSNQVIFFFLVEQLLQ